MRNPCCISLTGGTRDARASVRRRARRGFTLTEMMIGATILILLSGTLLQSLVSLRGMSAAGAAQAKLQDMGQRALDSIVADLKRSGPMVIGATVYPYVFDNGNPDAFHAGHAHAPAVQAAQAGDLDFGANREIVFLLPADADGNDVPDTDAAGDLSWDPTEISYVVITGPDGTNVLERRTNAANPRRIATNVERIVFDDAASSGFAIPLNCVRVQIFFRMLDEDRNLHRSSVQLVVRLRN